MHVTFDSKRVFGSFTRTVNEVISVQVEHQHLWITVNASISPCVLHVLSVFWRNAGFPQKSTSLEIQLYVIDLVHSEIH